MGLNSCTNRFLCKNAHSKVSLLLAYNCTSMLKVPFFLDLYYALFRAVVVVFVFNIPPTANVIWRWGHGLKSHPTRSGGNNSIKLIDK